MNETFINIDLVPRCGDLVKNGGETDVDCGGSDCPPCESNELCKINRDCDRVLCTNSTCQSKQNIHVVRNICFCLRIHVL